MGVSTRVAVVLLLILAAYQAKKMDLHRVEKFLHERRNKNKVCYGVIFDAGSSGTRVYAYNWPCRRDDDAPRINITQEAPAQKVTPGLSTYYNNIGGIKAYLDPLMKFAQSNVAADRVQFTPIMLGATAGLRLLTQAQQNAIIKEVRSIFRSSGFYFKPQWARVITGTEEGSFLWLSANYLADNLNYIDAGYNNRRWEEYPEYTFATIDLGGASTQLAFLPKRQKIQDSEFNIEYETQNGDELDFDLYAHSWLGYGQDQARLSCVLASINNATLQAGTNGQVYNFPCFQTGVSTTVKDNQGKAYSMQGTSDFQACRNLITTLLNNTYSNCDQKQCGVNGFYEPTFKGVYNFTAVSSYQYAAQYMGTVEYNVSSIESFYDTFCNLTWAQVQAQYPQYAGGSNAKYAVNQCFLGMYSALLLSEGFKIPRNSSIYSPADINGVEPTWTLAAMFYQLAQTESCEDDSPFCQYRLKHFFDQISEVPHVKENQNRI